MKKLSVLLLLLLPLMAFADQITEPRAREIAERFFASSCERSGRSVQTPSLKLVWDGESKMTRSTAAPAFYVYNNEAEKGFVVVSGDDRTVAPILAYAMDQHFDAEDMPVNLSTWMKGIRSEILATREEGVSVPERGTWKQVGYKDIQPVKLLQTALWDQRAPYNSKLPLGYVTGCPATAIAIIMRYHKWPEKGVGTIPESNDKIGSIQLGHTYDWENMPLTYNDLPSDYQKEQVGVLMRDVGAMVRTQYGGGTAGANPEETLPQLMPIYMRYNAKTIKSLFKRNFSDEEWHAKMRKELDENRPILYGGYSSGGGHQFVLDGYANDNYYHVNWGWSGVSNGYYLLTVMNPPEQGAGGSSSADGFTQKQDAIIGIQPDPTNPGGGFFDLMAYKPVGTKPYGMFSDTKDYQVGVAFTVTLKEFQNKGSREFRGQLAIAHCSADGGIKGIISSEVNYRKYPLEINDHTESNPLVCTISQDIAQGDYLCGVFKYVNPSDWTPIRNGYLERLDCIEKIVMKELTKEYAVKTSAGNNFADRALATFSAAQPTTPSSAEVEAYWAEQRQGDQVMLRKLEPQGDVLVIPPHTGVVLSTPSAMSFKMVPSVAAVAAVGEGNLLRATGDAEVEVMPETTAYILAKKTGNLLFHLLSPTDRKIAANRAYLVLNEAMGSQVKMVFDETTGIDTPELGDEKNQTVYDLSGRVVVAPLKTGVYIQNGKKFIIR